MSNTSITEINENLKLLQNQDGLTFGSDAFLLSAFLKGGRGMVGADLGSGTGIIPLLALARDKATAIHAIEVQESFAEIIQKNAVLNGFEDRLIPHACDLRELTAVHLGREMDFVTANPPYMTADSGKRNEHDEKYIARHEVCGGIFDFCACAGRLLKHGGRFYCVFRPDRLVDLIVALREYKLEPKVLTFVSATPESQPSMVLVRAVKGGAPGATVTRTLFLHDTSTDAKQSRLSADAQEIYDSGSFTSFLKI